MLVQREHLHQRIFEALTLLATHYEEHGALSCAITYLRRQIELEPWREEAHRQLMCVLAMNGARAAALAQYARCCQILDDELGVEPAEETVALYKRIREDNVPRRHADTVAPSSAHPRARAPAHNLPQQPTPFVGRERELAEIANLLNDPSCRLVTLVGPGGIGKTRLALAATEKYLSTSASEAVFVPLAPVRTPELLVPTIADAVGLSFYGQDDPQEQLLDYLRNKSMLLVLDNFEHLLDDVAIVGAMLEQTSAVTILVTSRERLNLHGEWVFEVEGLRTPSESREQIEQFSAVQLFTQSAQRARATFALQSGDHVHVAHICQLVGGMPLGIELAAAWTSVLPCSAIALEIERTLDFLTTTLQNVPARHRSMRAVFDHSWHLLSERERTVFMKLSIFRGGFTREAVSLVAEANLPVLLALANKSLLRQRNDGRYEIHELLRQYGEDQLKQHPQVEQETHTQHAAFYALFLKRYEAQLKDAQTEALRETAAELENIRIAWRWAAEQRHWDTIGAGINSMFAFFASTGRAREADTLFNDAAAQAERAAGEHDDDRQREIALGKLLGARGGFLFRLGFYEQATAVLERSIVMLRRYHEPAALALSLNLLAATVHLLGQYEKECQLLRESITQGRAASDDWIVAYSLNDLGMALFLLGKTDEAEPLSRESLAIFQRLGDRRGLAFTFNNLGFFAQQRGDYADAEQLYSESLQIRRAIGDQWGVATVLIQLGVTVGATEATLQRSRAYLLESLQRAREVRSLPTMLDGLVELAATLGCEGDLEQAHMLLAACLQHPSLSQRARARTERLLTAFPRPTYSVNQVAGAHSAEQIIAELLEAAATF